MPINVHHHKYCKQCPSTTIETYSHIHNVEILHIVVYCFPTPIPTLWSNKTLEKNCNVFGVHLTSMNIPFNISLKNKKYIFNSSLKKEILHL
jgi:hypothetical protein